jgi:hypothetical protein
MIPVDKDTQFSLTVCLFLCKIPGNFGSREEESGEILWGKNGEEIGENTFGFQQSER